MVKVHFIKTKPFRLLATSYLVTLACGCTEEAIEVPTAAGWPVLPASPYVYENVQFPQWFQVTPLQFFQNIPANNPLTNEGATLGRVLFYDTHLSATMNTSCGSCHHQERGFADVSAFSIGHRGGHTRRNSMHLVNMQYNSRFFWDLRAQGLEQQVLMPIQDTIEMGLSLQELVQRIQSLPYYPDLFKSAFGDEEVTTERISRALAQFIRAMVSYRTRYDDGLADDFAHFSPLEKEGMELFFSNATRCSFCHMTVNFFNPQAMHNGLDAEYSDNGQGGLTGNASQNGKFKVPSLRNVALTAPYMHDGRFATLTEVIEHYNSGIQPHPNLDDRLTVEGAVGGTPLQMNLSAQQVQALVAFLQTLTDEHLLHDPKFSDPFGQ